MFKNENVNIMSKNDYFLSSIILHKILAIGLSGAQKFN